TVATVATVALATRRLAILDLSAAGAQPMTSACSDLVLAYNGEIYNHEALRAELEAKGHRYRSRTDTETVLHAYEEWGTDAFRRFNGMFAFAVFDRRSGELVLARDRRGIKPLYYGVQPDRLVFASEMKALLESGAVDAAVDPTALWLFLCLGFVPSPHALCAGVRKLEPGHYLRLKDGAVTVRRFAGQDPIPEPLGGPAAAETLRQALDGAVRRQLMSDVPVGAFLSGGIDSTVIVALAQRYHPKALHTFSIGYLGANGRVAPAAYNDDLAYARQVSEEVGTVHHEVLLDPRADLSALVADLVAQLDEPLVEPVFVSTHFLAQLARAQGVPVVLTGDGADELFGGYRRYAAARRLARYERLPGVERLVPALAAVVKAGAAGENLRGLQRLLGQTPVEQYLTFSTIYQPDQALALLRPELRSGVDTAALARVAADAMPSAGTLADRMAAADLQLWLGEHFNPRLDRITMRHSVEARVPYQDDAVVQAALAVPFGQRTHPSRPKALLLDACGDLIPESVRTRPKRHYQAPSDDWLRVGLGAALAAANDAQDGVSGIFDPASFRASLATGDGAPGSGHRRWALLIASLWGRHYLR
ncbi:MAG: asparagine synthase (glutamine-hydrolyzing), partial [Chloroflexota bacterium]